MAARGFGEGVGVVDIAGDDGLDSTAFPTSVETERGIGTGDDTAVDVVGKAPAASVELRLGLAEWTLVGVCGRVPGADGNSSSEGRSHGSNGSPAPTLPFLTWKNIS